MNGQKLTIMTLNYVIEINGQPGINDTVIIAEWLYKLKFPSG